MVANSVHTTHVKSGLPNCRVIVRKYLIFWWIPSHMGGRGSQVVKVSDHGWHVMSSTVQLKTSSVGERCPLNFSRASRWCGVVGRRGGASSNVVLVT
ncbi:hypothetical protein TNCV_222651 [Trichonephila clavipes]|nr:hypothetical protein TNCV_222651 [Trichonephila clavipes]